METLVRTEEQPLLREYVQEEHTPEEIVIMEQIDLSALKKEITYQCIVKDKSDMFGVNPTSIEDINFVYGIGNFTITILSPAILLIAGRGYRFNVFDFQEKMPDFYEFYQETAEKFFMGEERQKEDKKYLTKIIRHLLIGDNVEFYIKLWYLISRISLGIGLAIIFLPLLIKFSITMLIIRALLVSPILLAINFIKNTLVQLSEEILT